MKICPRCRAELRDMAKYCSMCGRKLVKTNFTEGPFGTSIRPLIIFLVALFIGTAIIGGIFSFLYFTAGEMESKMFSSHISLVGDGETEFSIPVTLSNLLGIKMNGVKIEAETSEGLVESCITNEEGTCEIIFIPPKKAVKSTAEIAISGAGKSRTIEIEITPDTAHNISIELTYSEIPADGVSGTRITVYALDKLENNVPDGTKINFELNPQGYGSLSKNYCETSDGVCDVNYIGPATPGTVIVAASSGNAVAYKEITVKQLEPSKITLILSNDSIIGNGKSTLLITAYVENIIGKPIGNYIVEFETTIGTVENNCTTGSDGKCMVEYTAPYSSGQAVVSAFTGNASSSASIELLGFSNLQVYVEHDPYVGNPIVPAFALNHEYLGENMVALTIFNEGTTAFSGTVTVEITGWSSEQTSQLNLAPDETEILYFNPPLKNEAYSNVQTQSAQYHIAIKNNQGIFVFQHSVPVDITASNYMYWHDPYYGNYADYHNDVIVAWVTPDSSEIHSLLADAASYTPTNAILGYQTYTSGCGGPCTQEESTSIQMEAVYNELQSEGMHYVNAPGNYFSNAQTVYTPEQSLDAGGANCIDGAIVYASAIVSAGMHAYLILVPGHSFTCVRASPTSEFISCVETTMIGSGSTYDEAVTEGNSEFNSYYANGNINILDVNSILADGMKSIPG